MAVDDAVGWTGARVLARLRTFHREIFASSTDRFASIDGMRGLAQLHIMLFHCVWYVGPVNPHLVRWFTEQDSFWHHLVLAGPFAVDLFLVISGFLITNLLLRDRAEHGRIRIGRFYVRRALRLLPAYYVMLAFTYFFFALDAHKVRYVWANLAYVNNLLPSQDIFMGWTWSLAVEEQFYLIWPWLLAGVLVLRRGAVWTCLLVALAGSFAINVAITAVYDIRLPFKIFPWFGAVDFSVFFDVLYDKLWTRYGAVLLGCIGAFFYRSPWFPWYARSRVIHPVTVVCALLVAGLPVYPFSYYGPAPSAYAILPENVARFIFYGASRSVYALGWLGLMLFTLARPQGILSRLFGNRLTIPFGQLSYVMFLIHPILIYQLLGWFGARWLGHDLNVRDPLIPADTLGLPSVALFFALIASCSLVLGYLLALLVERPGMHLRERLEARFDSRPTAPNRGDVALRGHACEGQPP